MKGGVRMPQEDYSGFSDGDGQKMITITLAEFESYMKRADDDLQFWKSRVLQAEQERDAAKEELRVLTAAANQALGALEVAGSNEQTLSCLRAALQPSGEQAECWSGCDDPHCPYTHPKDMQAEADDE